MEHYNTTQIAILENLCNLKLGLESTEDLNTEREAFRRNVQELIYILVLEA